MEENQNVNRTGEQGDKNASSGGNHHNRNHRRRHHRPHRPHGDTPEKAPVSAEQAEQPAEQKKNGDGRQGGQSHHQKKNNRPERSVQDTASTDEKAREEKKKGDGQSNGRKKHHDRRNRSKGHRGNERGPYDPYEEPSADELSLAELRARIVLKSADDPISSDFSFSSPSLSSPQKSVFAEELPAEEINVDHILNPVESEKVTDDNEEKVEIVGIRFRASGKTYYFDPQGIQAKKGQYAIVETARGSEFGDVCVENTMISAKDTVSPLRPIIRIATDEDIRQNEENRKKERDALVICKEKIEAHKLDMKLVDAQYAFDGSKLLFYFTADGRVDFRELVKDLASAFHTRIELRQIGIRDEAKMLGGLGACGRALCCSTFLPDFAQVSIKMAKEQNLSLNSSKISGVCGRLMCCLRFESDVYGEEIRKTPSVDALVKTEDGIGQVISVNPLAGTIRVIFKDKPDMAPKQFHRNEVTVVEKEKKSNADKPKNAPEQ